MIMTVIIISSFLISHVLLYSFMYLTTQNMSVLQAGVHLDIQTIAYKQ